MDHQYSSGDYSLEAKDSTVRQSYREEDQPDEEEPDQDEDEEGFYQDSPNYLSPSSPGSDTETSLRERLCTPVSEAEEDEEQDAQGSRDRVREGPKNGNDQDSNKAFPSTVVIEVRSEDDADDEEEHDAVSEGSGVTDDSENWDMTRGNLVLLEQAIALKAEEVKGTQGFCSSPNYQPYRSPKSSEPAAGPCRTSYYSKGTVPPHLPTLQSLCSALTGEQFQS